MIPGYWSWFEPFECRVFLVFECRVSVRSGLLVVIQRVAWVMVWHGERPGKSGAPQLTSTSSTHFYFYFFYFFHFYFFYFDHDGHFGLPRTLNKYQWSIFLHLIFLRASLHPGPSPSCILEECRPRVRSEPLDGSHVICGILNVVNVIRRYLVMER